MQDNPNYSYVHTVRDDEGHTHYIKDAEAREAITGLETSKQDVIDSSHKLSVENISGLAAVATSGSYSDLTNKPTIDTAMSDSSTNAVQNKVAKKYVDDSIKGLGTLLNFKGVKSTEEAIKALASADKGDVWICSADNSEWVCTEDISVATASSWERLGPTIDLSGYELKENLRALAYKYNASGTYTPAGSVSVDSYKPEGEITMEKYTPVGDVTINSIRPSGSIRQGSGETNYTPEGSVTIDNYTPAGSVSAPTITVAKNTTTVNSISDVGTLPQLSVTVNDGILSFSFNPGTLPTQGRDTTVVTDITSATATAPSFTGSPAQLSGSFTGEGVSFEFEGDVVTPTGAFTGSASRPTGTFEGKSKTPTASFTGSAGTVTVS